MPTSKENRPKKTRGSKTVRKATSKQRRTKSANQATQNHRTSEFTLPHLLTTPANWFQPDKLQQPAGRSSTVFIT
jgi:hypothetical protein